MKTCVFAGTFDPFTNGHKYVVDKCLEMFDNVVIALGTNVDKKPLFSVNDRVKMLESEYGKNPRVQIKCFDGMLTDFMKENGILINVRGIRDQDDYKYETTMARYNSDMYPEMTTVYLPTPVTLTYVSSSAVRNIIENKADFSAYIPNGVYSVAKSIIDGSKGK